MICHNFMPKLSNEMGGILNTQNTGSLAYTQHWVLYTWDELIMSISQVEEPLHELEEDLSRSYT